MSFDQPPINPWTKWIALGFVVVVGGAIAVALVLTTPSDKDCAGGCLDIEAAESLYPSKGALRPIGMLANVGYEGTPQWDANAYAVRSGVNWQRSDGTPAVCEFASQWGVLGAAPLTEAEEDDPTIDFGGWYSDFDEVGQLVRVLDGEAEATALIGSLDSAIDECPGFSIKSNVTDTYEPTVSKAEFEVVESASVVAWIEETHAGTSTIVFVQERNLVTRILASSYPDTALTHEQLATFVRETSRRMSELTP
jgi:hypothetical protein